MYGKKRGYFVGTVTAVEPDSIQLEAVPDHLKNGDGVVFENLKDTNDEQGGRIYGIRGRWLDFQRGRLRSQYIRPGMDALGHKVTSVNGDSFNYGNHEGNFNVDFGRGAGAEGGALAWQATQVLS